MILFFSAFFPANAKKIGCSANREGEGKYMGGGVEESKWACLATGENGWVCGHGQGGSWD